MADHRFHRRLNRFLLIAFAAFAVSAVLLVATWL